MKIGTISLFFGAHQFILHPLIVAYAWWKLYGFPYNPKLWLCFLVHDWGYFGKPNMDGEEGELHPALGWDITHLFLGSEWGWFCLMHSRKMHTKVQNIISVKLPVSRLCVADKLATLMTPKWMYRKKELEEYLDEGDCSSFEELRLKLKQDISKFIEENKDNALRAEDYKQYI